VKLPFKGSTMKFCDWDKTIRPAFIIYGDIECILEKSTHESCLQKHTPIAAAFLILSKDNINHREYHSFKGRNCLIQFMEKIESKGKKILTWIENNSNNAIEMTVSERQVHINAGRCYLCKQELLPNDKCADHDHYTGKYLGPAHFKCNIKRRERRRNIPVIFHNLSYDMHHIIKHSLSHFPHWKLNVIAKTSEDYMCLDAYIRMPQKNYSLHLKFIDSYRFLSSSLQNLTDITKDFPITSTLGISTEYRKGVFPYSYITSESILLEEHLPKYENFYDILAKRIKITKDDYIYAQYSWKQNNCRNIYDYLILYLKIDVHILADVFEQFRCLVYKEDNLEATCFISLPGLSWSSALKFYGKEIELLHDAEMYEFFERGIRGGITFVNTHHVTRTEEDKLLYVDANNLYGHALSMKLPISEFTWIDGIEAYSNMENDSFGMVVEVDLSIPECLMDYCDDLPFAPEKLKIQEQWLTKQMLKEWKLLNSEKKFHGTEKLLLTHLKKENYIIHSEMLKFYIKHGIIVEKYHRAVRFREDYVFRDYIAYNSLKRSHATTGFEKDYYKLRNNALYGKSVENLRNRINFRLVNNVSKFHAYTSRATFTTVKYFDENLVGIQLMKEEVLLDRPIYI